MQPLIPRSNSFNVPDITSITISKNVGVSTIQLVWPDNNVITLTMFGNFNDSKEVSAEALKTLLTEQSVVRLAGLSRFHTPKTVYDFAFALLDSSKFTKDFQLIVPYIDHALSRANMTDWQYESVTWLGKLDFKFENVKHEDNVVTIFSVLSPMGPVAQWYVNYPAECKLTVDWSPYCPSRRNLEKLEEIMALYVLDWCSQFDVDPNHKSIVDIQSGFYQPARSTITLSSNTYTGIRKQTALLELAAKQNEINNLTR